ncbi:MAG: family 16 glycosylhydrolase [Paludibacteraceae bacterium]|jgi:hypothetical protein|nr:family 16 glycosylhydrolase [Paludibacteraceae bacterium]
MNLFFKKLFGKLTKTEKFEKEEGRLLAAYKRYCDVQTSAELKEYTELFHIVKSAAFQEKKKTLQNRKFSDTEEYRDARKYEKLENNADVKQYFQTLVSPSLKEYLEFKKTPDYEKLGDPNIWKTDERLSQFKAYEKSAEFKNFERLNGSYIIKEYEKLRNIVTTDEFKQRKAFWENKDRWKTTEEYKQEQRFYELQRTESILFYEKTNPKEFQKLDEWKLTFEDTFDGNTLSNQWSQGNYHRAQSLKRIYSLANEKQATTDGSNVQVTNSTMNINTLSERVKGLTWDPSKGFFSKEFAFTSGAVNTGDFFQQRYGKIQAKIRIVNKKSDVSHAFWLGTDGKLPHINIFAYNGKEISVGLCTLQGNEVKKDRDVIKGISAENYYVYTLEWTPQEIVWKVNNITVKKVKNNISSAMYLAFNSFIGPNNEGGNATMQVEWVKAYLPKSMVTIKH